MRKLPYYTNWTFAHPPAAELAAKLAELAPPEINRAFFVSGGSEAVESAWKLARQYHAANGQPMRRKVISRKVAYHGTTMGALSITGITSIRTPFEPLWTACATSPTPTATAASTARTRTSARSRAPTRWPRRSSRKGPRPSPW